MFFGTLSCKECVYAGMELHVYFPKDTKSSLLNEKWGLARLREKIRDLDFWWNPNWYEYFFCTWLVFKHSRSSTFWYSQLLPLTLEVAILHSYNIIFYCLSMILTTFLCFLMFPLTASSILSILLIFCYSNTAPLSPIPPVLWPPYFNILLPHRE